MKRSARLAAPVAFLASCLAAPAESPASARASDPLPDNVVVAVSNVPPALGRVTSHELDRAMAQVAAPRPVPRPGGPRYERVEHAAIESSLESIWLQGQAAEMGIKASAGEISRELTKLKRQNFDSYRDYRRFLKQFHYTPRDVNERVKVQILATKLEERVYAEVEYPGQQQHALDEFATAFHKRWRARTICATGHIVAGYCSNA